MHDALLTLAGLPGTFWLPERAANEPADQVDFTFYFIYYVCAFFFVVVVVLAAIFAWRYRQSRAPQADASHAHNTPLEIAWSVLPTFLLAMMFYFGFEGYMNARIPPADAYNINVRAQMWKWSFEYPTGAVTDTLVVPVDRNVKVTLSSRDVLHSFYVPAFRVKMDVVPGRYTTAWFHPTTPGEYLLTCAEYCGTDHSAMHTPVKVVPAAQFDTWLAEQSAAKTPLEAGQQVYTTKGGCVACHTIDGTPRIGPSWKGLYGSQVTLTTGQVVTADDNYLRESILDPNKNKRQGFENGVMPPFQGSLTEDDVSNVIAFIKTLK